MTAAAELGINVDLDLDAATAELRVREALAVEGFGVLTEIDVQKTLQTKLGINMPAYRILGACNPSLAHRGISADPTVGMLLPCNVVVRAIAGGTRVEFADPIRMLDLIDNPTLHEVAVEARERLVRVAGAIAAYQPGRGTDPRAADAR